MLYGTVHAPTSRRGSEVSLQANETAASSVRRSSSTPSGTIPRRLPSVARRRTPSPWSPPRLSPPRVPSSPSAFLSLERALRRSVRALRRSLLGHNSSASSPLGYFLPPAAR